MAKTRLLFLCLKCIAVTRSMVMYPQGAVKKAVLSADEVLNLLKGSEYAVDISSATENSEKETYVGKASGVNEGIGLGALSAFFRNLIGKALTWKNRPVYDKLWDIIEEDCLAMCKERIPDLRPASTWFEPEHTRPYVFCSKDNSTCGSVASYQGANVDWLTTCKFFNTALGFGNMRIDAWLDRSTRAPHLAIHLCVVFNVLFIYIDLIPRTNLLFDDAYSDYVYATKKSNGKSLNDIFIHCVEKKRMFKRYFSKSHVVNAFMISPTVLLYTLPKSKKNLAEVRQISLDYTSIFLDMAQEAKGLLVDNVENDKSLQTELLQTDTRFRLFCCRDPDTKNVAGLFGFDLTDKLVRTLCGSPHDPVWKSR